MKTFRERLLYTVRGLIGFKASQVPCILTAVGGRLKNTGGRGKGGRLQEKPAIRSSREEGDKGGDPASDPLHTRCTALWGRMATVER